MVIIMRRGNRNNKVLKNFDMYMVLTYKQAVNDYKRAHLIKSLLRFNIL